MPLLLDRLAQRYRTLPSKLLDCEWIDFEINYLAMEAGAKEDERQRKIQEAKMKMKRGL